MKDIDARPTDYRQHNPETGRVEHPVNRGLAKVMTAIGLATTALLCWQSVRADLPIMFAIAPAIVAALTGFCFALTIRRLNW